MAEYLNKKKTNHLSSKDNKGNGNGKNNIDIGTKIDNKVNKAVN